MDLQTLPDYKFFNYLPPGAKDTAASASALNLNITSSWTYCGPLLPVAYDELPPSFHAWAKATVNGALAPSLLPLLRYIDVFFRDAAISHYWLTIRATKGSNEFDLPRWHTDDLFFRFPVDAEDEYPKAKEQWKVAATILGPGTMFIQDGQQGRLTQKKIKAQCRDESGSHVCTSIRCLGCASTAQVIREKLAEAFKDYEVVQAPAQEALFFRVGQDDGAIHSEPPSHADRIFVNAIPGTEEELQRVLSKWGMEYPRSWSIGVPIGFD